METKRLALSCTHVYAHKHLPSPIHTQPLPSLPACSQQGP